MRREGKKNTFRENKIIIQTMREKRGIHIQKEKADERERQKNIKR